MAIGNVVERIGTIFIYDERGLITASIGAGDGLKGYTSSTVTIQRGNQIFTYDEQGRLVSSMGAR